MLLNSIVLQITSSCPHKCPQCYMEKGNSNLSMESARKYIEWASLNGAKVVQLTGGEPLVYPYLTELLHCISKYNMATFLATSGYAHSYEAYNLLKKSGLSAICVSITDIDEANNDRTRDAFVQSISAIDDAQEVGLTCFANVVVSDSNIARLKLMGEYLKAHGVYGVNILRPVKSFDGKYRPDISRETIESLKNIVEQEHRFYRVENCFQEYWAREEKSFKCHDIGNKTVFVNVDGSVSPCSKMMRYKYRSLEQMLQKSSEWECGCL